MYEPGFFNYLVVLDPIKMSNFECASAVIPYVNNPKGQKLI